MQGGHNVTSYFIIFGAGAILAAYAIRGFIREQRWASMRRQARRNIAEAAGKWRDG